MADQLMDIRVERILPNPEQPRRVFDEGDLRGLADSIRRHGVILPIAVEEADNGFYILHDGERRVRAARMVGLETVPARVTPGLNGSAKTERLVRALVANVQRADLDPIEEAHAYQALASGGMSIDEVAAQVGRSRATVDSRLRLLWLDEPIQALVASGELHRDRSMTEALLAIPDAQARVEVAERLAEDGVKLQPAVEAAKEVAEALNTVLHPKVSNQRERGKRTPGIRYAQAPEEEWPEWDALYQLGRVPPWPVVTEAVMSTCDVCPLRPMASEATCGSCPLVMGLRAMVKAVGK